METLLYVLGFIIGALGTWFVLYYLKTRKTLRTRHKVIMNLTFALVGKDISEMEKKKKDKEVAETVKKVRESAKEDDGCSDCHAGENPPEEK